MYITGKSLPRRRSCAEWGPRPSRFPFLDSMVPALELQVRAPLRMAFAYVPNGIIMDHWNRPRLRRQARRTSARVEAMEPHRDDILMLGNLTHNTGRALLDGAGDHGRCSGSYLTGIQVKKTTTDIRAGVSCDQIVANTWRTKRASPRSKWAWRMRGRRAIAIPATPAPTPTISRGRAKRSRCPLSGSARLL